MPRSPFPDAPPAAGDLVVGRNATAELTVTDADTAVALGSGDVSVLATPRLVALCEEATLRCVEGLIPATKTTVASRVQFDHLLPVPVGLKVVAEATLERVEGRRLVFTVATTLRCDTRTGLVGAGRLTRVLVHRDAFMDKAAGGCS